MALIYRIFSRAWAYVTGEGNPSIVVYSSTGRLPDVGIRRYSAASGYGTVRAGV